VSIEQSVPFHTVRRILRALDPEWRIMANQHLASHESAIDHRHKTVEVGETTPIMDGVAILLFSIGHVKLRKKKEFSLYFGEGIRKWRFSEKKLLSNLVEQAMKVDRLALDWAKEMLCLYWPLEPNHVQATLEAFV
jgi:hypothetical protein